MESLTTEQTIPSDGQPAEVWIQNIYRKRPYITCIGAFSAPLLTPKILGEKKPSLGI